MYLIILICLCLYLVCTCILFVYVYVYLYTGKMNDSNGSMDRRKELGLLCYYKVLKLSMKWYTLLFESGLQLVLNLYCNVYENCYNIFRKYN